MRTRHWRTPIGREGVLPGIEGGAGFLILKREGPGLLFSIEPLPTCFPKNGVGGSYDRRPETADNGGHRAAGRSTTIVALTHFTGRLGVN